MTVSFPDEIPARFVVLHHAGVAEPHFDLMIEMSPGSLLATWRSPQWPITRPTDLIRLPDHRAIYLGFEGELSENRGRVIRVASGMGTAGPEQYRIDDVILERNGSSWTATPTSYTKK